MKILFEYFLWLLQETLISDSFLIYEFADQEEANGVDQFDFSMMKRIFFCCNSSTFLRCIFFKIWIDRKGQTEWSPRSQYIMALDYFLWGYLKSKVYSKCQFSILLSVFSLTKPQTHVKFR